MPPVQTTYSATHDVAYAGQVSNSEPWNAVSRNVEGASGLGFGWAVIKGTADDGVLDAASGTIRGITVRDTTLDPANPDTYPQDSTAAILKQGVIAVTAGGTATAGAPAYYVPSTHRFVDSSAGPNVAVPTGVFDTSGTDGVLVKLRINMP